MKNTRKYGIFEVSFSQNGKRRTYTRVPNTAAFSKQAAIRIYQDYLITSAFTSKPLELRPVKED